MAVIIETVARKTAFFKTLDDADEVPVYLEKGVKLKELSNGEFFYREPFADIPYYHVESSTYGEGYIPMHYV